MGEQVNLTAIEAGNRLNRNGKNPNKIFYKQIFNFVYKDNATILTIGGIVFDKSQRNQIKKMDFDSLSFTKTGINPYEIKSPNLTFREIKALDKLLPDDMEFDGRKFTNKKLSGIPLIPTDIRNYAKIYRYYPNFTEANL